MKILWTHNFDPKALNSGCFLNAIYTKLKLQGVDVDMFYLGNLRNPFNVLFKVLELRTLSKKYDLVHSQYGSICAFVTSFVAKPKLLSIRGNDWTVHSARVNWLFLHTRFARFLTIISINRYDGVLPVSNRLRKEITKIYRREVPLIFPSPIDLAIWKERAPNETNQNHTYRILFVSLNKSNPIKRFSVAQQAIDILKKRIPNVELSLASGIPFCNMPDFVAAHDVILSLSESEGWPNSVKEALACNVPFVATDVSDLKEIVEVEYSCMLTTGEPHDVAEKLFVALSQKKPKNLRKYVESMDVSASASRLLTYYDKVLKAREKYHK